MPVVRIWVANADGSNARTRGNVVRAAELAWFPDGQRLLFAGRDADGGNPGIYAFDTTTGALTRIVDAFSPRGVRLAPDGSHLVYLAALEEQPEDNGLFIVNADGSAKRNLPLIGGPAKRREAILRKGTVWLASKVGLDFASKLI